MFIKKDTRPQAVLKEFWNEIIVIEENAEFRDGIIVEALQ